MGDAKHYSIIKSARELQTTGKALTYAVAQFRLSRAESPRHRPKRPASYVHDLQSPQLFFETSDAHIMSVAVQENDMGVGGIGHHPEHPPSPPPRKARGS
jgi:hypothetical protein